MLYIYANVTVTPADWSPCYDIRVSSKEKDMELTYYGTVKQDTGEDWNHARISLSTSHPMVGGMRVPVLNVIVRLTGTSRRLPSAVPNED